MGLVVQKYGGTSVANLAKIQSVANIIIKAKKRGDNVVAVVSAMAGETDKLVKACIVCNGSTRRKGAGRNHI